MKRIYAGLIASCMAALAAQDLTKPPETPPIPAFKLPPVVETKIANGLQVVLIEDKRFPIVTVRMVFQAGSKFDPKDQPGLAGNVAALLTEGTKTRSQRQIAEELASIGGALSGNASPDALTLSASALAEHLPKLLGLMADVAINAAFPTEEIELHRANRKQALMAQKAQPNFLASERFSETVFGAGNPYAHIAPTVEALDKMDAKGLAGFRDTYLVPNNAHLILLGSIPPRAESVKLVESHFGKWPQKPVNVSITMRSPEPKREIILVDRPGSVQADIHAGQLAVTRMHPDQMPLRVGSIILGGGASSRMFNEIREKQGFAYDAHTELDVRRETGVFKAVTQVRNEVIEPAMAALLKELEQMGKERVAAEELSNAKNFVSGTFLLNLETQGGLANQIAMTKEMGIPVSYIENFTVNIRAVEPDQIQKAAAKYITAEDATIVIVGDASKIAKPLEKFGSVRVVKP
jgi:zinc protease